MTRTYRKMRLGDILTLEYGKPLPKEDRTAEGKFPVFGANGVKAYTNVPYHTESSIIVGRKGTAGAVTMAEGGFWPLDVTYFVTFDKTQYVRRYLYYLLCFLDLPRLATGVKPGINRNNVYSIECLVPSFEEQRRIVAILDEAFTGIEMAIANTEKNLANARELGETSLEKIISGFDTTEKVLADVVAEDCSLSYGIVQPGKERDEGLLVVRPVDLTQPTITSNGLKRIDPEKATSYLRTKLQGGDLLLCVRGTTGTVAQASEELAGGNVTRGIVPIRYSSEFVDQGFGYYLLRSAHVQSQIREKTYGAALMQINIRDLRKIKLNVPPVEQQKEMVVMLRRVEADLSSLRSHYQHKLNSLNELRQSLLQKAFSGELTADRAEEELEPATV